MILHGKAMVYDDGSGVSDCFWRLWKGKAMIPNCFAPRIEVLLL